MTKKIIAIILIIGAVLWGGYSMRDIIFPLFFTPQEPVGVEEGLSSEEVDEPEVIAQDLEIPWEIVFLSDQEMLVTQRPGKVLLIGEGEEYEIEEVRHVGEGGLLGMDTHPNFEENGYLYLYMTSESENKVDRYVFDGESLVFDQNIIDNIPANRFHNGGRIKFGPDGFLYITTGDAQNDNLAQQRDSLAGKILRITDEGEIPEENPFGTEVFSYGHRNPQGITWDSEDRLWATEHGPSANDELNLIEAGKNYGWPEIVGDEETEGMETPKLQSGDDYTWAPTGTIFWNGSIFFTGLRGSAIYEARISDGEVGDFLIHFEEEFGRMR
ncbi:MAG: PQQ-dependent sugar dehydrogenase, partial [Patescibacteria group bacterium]